MNKLITLLKQTGLLEIIIKLITNLFNRTIAKNPQHANVIQWIATAVLAAQWLIDNYTQLPIPDDVKMKIYIVASSVLAISQLFKEKK